MNEKHKSQSVRRASKHLLNIYLILAVLFCSFGQLSAQNSEGKITGKRTKKGKTFYGCNRFPKCDFALWDKPVNEFCPKCDSILIQKSKNKIKCSNKECDYAKDDK